jgi:hypothetical protein
MTSGAGYLERPAPSGLADVIETILDKGIVIDAYARISLVGIEILTIDARIVVASVDTYLRFAEATNRLELEAVGPRSLPDMLTEGVRSTVEHVAANVVEGKIEDVKDSVKEKVEDAKESVEDVAESVTGAIGTAAEKVTHKVEGVFGHDDS